MNNMALKPNIICIISFLVLFLLPLPLLATLTPWELEADEKYIDGTLLEANSYRIKIINGTKEFLYTPHTNIFAALMGTRSGHMLNLADFPLNIEVELYIDKENKVRAMRNKQIDVPADEGILLHGWGHNASLSPDELYYCVYNWETGLQLYQNSSDPKPIYLSSLPVSSWNYKNELAVVRNDDILIFDPLGNKRTILPLPELKSEDLSRIITNISWDYHGEKLFYTSLEDYADTESNVFDLTVVNKKGQILNSAVIANLGPAIWLADNQIIYITYDNLDEANGKIMLWDYETGKTSEFLSTKNTSFSNLAYSPKLGCLAYTEKDKFGESIFVFNLSAQNKQELYTSPFPLRNLQWSNDGCLFFWDEYNNCIFKLSLTEQGGAVPLQNGYLPAEAVRSNCLYFLAEPFEEPQQVFKNKPGRQPELTIGSLLKSTAVLPRQFIGSVVSLVLLFPFLMLV